MTIPTKDKIRIFHLYADAKVEFENDIHFLNTIGRTWIEIEQCDTNFGFITPIHDCQLLLKSLDNISDEDKQSIVEMVAKWDETNLLNYEDVSGWLDDVFTSNCATYSDYVSGNQFIQLIDHLRQLGYALPCMGYSVQEMIDNNIIKLI